MYDSAILCRGAICPGFAEASAPLSSRVDRLVAIPVISVIDDDASVRAAIGNLLRSLEYDVNVFSSAEAFLQSQHLNDTWCVIADVRMPAMSGIELQSHLRAKGSRLPFVFITALLEEDTRTRALSDGALCFLTKPFDEKDLIDCLRGIIERRCADKG